MTLSNHSEVDIRAVSRIKALGHSDSRIGVKRVVRWLSSRAGKKFIALLADYSEFCDLLHTDDYQNVFYRLADQLPQSRPSRN